MTDSKSDIVLDLASRNGIIRARDLAVHGIERVYLSRLADRGLLERRGRGMYAPALADITAFHTYALAARRVPHGVICLLSALRFHDLTTQGPFEIWMALEGHARAPRVDHPRLRVVHFSGPAFHEGVDEVEIDGVPVRVYNVAKTVVDCFRFRNKVGLDVAIEALRGCRERHRTQKTELWHYAEVCHISSVMRPYLEAVP